MEPPFLKHLGYPRAQPEIWKGRDRRGKELPSVSNYQQGTYIQEPPAKGSIPNHIQPCPTRKLGGCRESYSYASTPDRPIHMEYGKQNFYHDKILARDLSY
ncbi:hypothetical protein O181_004974 [Austropuccinia psidii MF-1]|uniref:Uncharacterized protein n=1 Tax=Austropuccinia psidii MF-1 TaxID=1389203 RepID=A0A9Q3BH93_9BASI|nr:hypothetical protein [Austropuccinia psidii MF-1]